eukprot:4906807-Heterocapsa_arctica.AAC.1
MVGLHVTRQAAPSQAAERGRDLRRIMTLEGRMYETQTRGKQPGVDMYETKTGGSWAAAKRLSSGWAEACTRWATAMNGPGFVKPNAV